MNYRWTVEVLLGRRTDHASSFTREGISDDTNIDDDFVILLCCVFEYSLSVRTNTYS